MAGILVAIAISIGIITFRQQLIGLATYGYVGLFFVAMFGSATIIFPMPGLVLAFAAGGSLSPLLVGLAFGSGAAIGELTGYLAGFGGSAMIESRAGYQQMRDWMKKWGAWVIFFLSLVPNPAFDIAGITAGALRIPVWLFVLASWAGNVVKATLVAFAGAGTMGVIGPLVRDWLAR
jgi:membrane protein YqaA with SNARE-associated domain